MERKNKNSNGVEVLQGRIHLIVSALLFLLLGLNASVVSIAFILKKFETAVILSFLIQSVFLFASSFVCFTSRNTKKRSKLVIALSVFYILLVLSNFFSSDGVGVWRLISLVIPINAIVGAYKNLKGIPLRKY